MLARYGCPQPSGGPCFAGAIVDNTFNKNHVRYLATLSDSELGESSSFVTFSGNEGECDQTYTGDGYCPLYRVAAPYELREQRLGNNAEPLDNCPGRSQFCLTQKRVTNLEPREGGCTQLNDP